MSRPSQHNLELVNFWDVKLSANNGLKHGFGQFQELLPVEEGDCPGVDELENHVDEFGGGGVAPVVVLKYVQHGTHHRKSKVLFGMMEAGLHQFGQVVVLGGADEAGDGLAAERTGTTVQVVNEQLERVAVELDYVKLERKMKKLR